MNVVEKRLKGRLAELKPLVKRIPPSRVKIIVNEVFSIDFFEPEPPVPFIYVDRQTLNWHIRPEARKGTFNTYWVMSKTINGRRYKKYLSPAGQLTIDILQKNISEVLSEVDK